MGSVNCIFLDRMSEDNNFLYWGFSTAHILSIQIFYKILEICLKHTIKRTFWISLPYFDTSMQTDYSVSAQMQLIKSIHMSSTPKAIFSSARMIDLSRSQSSRYYFL